MGFQEIIRPIEDGEPVNAAVTGRVDKALEQNIRYLRDLLAAAELGQAIQLYNQVVEADAAVGMAVYYNTANQEFRRALAAVDLNDGDGSLNTADSSQVWGVISSKPSARAADILLMGSFDIDLAAAVDGTLGSGLYYLSGTTPGKLVAQQPPISVPVLRVGTRRTGTTYTVLVNPRFVDLLEAHRHHRFSLICAPAGDTAPPSTHNDRHVITNQDSSLEGWLPASDPIFEGQAPAGAAFGYNLAASSLRHLWPPLPLQSAYLEWNKGESPSSLGMGVPLGWNELAVINANGLWWMSDAYGDAPWPLLLDTNNDDVSLSDSESIEAPRELHMSLTLWFSRPVFQSNASFVQSLVPVEGSGILIQCNPSGAPADVGPLQIGFDPEVILADAEDEPGSVVFKRLAGGKILRGPVVESVEAGSPNVHVTGGTLLDTGARSGAVMIAVDQNIDGAELPIEVVRLDSATEEYYKSTISLGFAAGRVASFVGSIVVPADAAVGDDTTCKLRFWILGKAAGAVPSDVFSLSYRVIARPSAVLTQVALPLSDTTLDIDCGITLAGANRYFEVESEEFAITAGAVVQFTLSRLSSDAYASDLQILRMRGVLTA